MVGVQGGVKGRPPAAALPAASHSEQVSLSSESGVRVKGVGMAAASGGSSGRTPDQTPGTSSLSELYEQTAPIPEQNIRRSGLPACGRHSAAHPLMVRKRRLECRGAVATDPIPEFLTCLCLDSVDELEAAENFARRASEDARTPEASSRRPHLAGHTWCLTLPCRKTGGGIPEAADGLPSVQHVPARNGATSIFASLSHGATTEVVAPHKPRLLGRPRHTPPAAPENLMLRISLQQVVLL